MNKKSFYLFLGIVFISLFFISTSLNAQDQPIQIAIVTPIQIFPDNVNIVGVRLNLIYGCNSSVTGLDVGFINHTTEGLSQGVQYGFVSLVDSDFTGWQNNLVNITKGNFKGFQLGIVNYANQMNGLQFGLVNYTVNMKGLQIGLVNMIKQKGAFSFFSIVNWSF